MGRFLKKSAYESIRGSKMQSANCGRGNQLSDSEIVIGDPAKKVLALLKRDHQKSVMLGIHAFFYISVDYLQSRLFLQNLNRLKKDNREQCQGRCI